jgi:hypothetical protein
MNCSGHCNCHQGDNHCHCCWEWATDTSATWEEFDPKTRSGTRRLGDDAETLALSFKAKFIPSVVWVSSEVIVGRRRKARTCSFDVEPVAVLLIIPSREQVAELLPSGGNQLDGITESPTDSGIHDWQAGTSPAFSLNHAMDEGVFRLECCVLRNPLHVVMDTTIPLQHRNQVECAEVGFGVLVFVRLSTEPVPDRGEGRVNASRYDSTANAGERESRHNRLAQAVDG